MDALLVAMSERTPQGIAAAISRLISEGRLAEGDRLPTVRELAAQLGVSPATVSHAWQRLASAGLIVSRGRSGSFVRSAPREWMPTRYRGLDSGAEASGAPGGGALGGGAAVGGGARLDLSRGTPDPELLPDLGPALARVAGRSFTTAYQTKPDIPELHDLLRETWPAPVESLTVTNGALDAIDRALDTLTRFGDRVAVEHPAFPPFLDLLEARGLETVPMEVDAEGVTPAAWTAALAASPRVLLVQPRAQNPTGASMTAARVERLARVLARSRTAPDAVVIEDDSSGLVATGDDLSLATWLPERVLHVRSYSKSHGPDLRIGALGGPRSLVDRVVARRLLGAGWTSRMTQALLFELLTGAESQAAVERARRVYAQRQRAFVAALAAHGIRQPLADGLNAWVRVPDEREALVAAAAAGIRLAPGAPFRATSGGTPAVRITVAVLRDDPAAVATVLAGH